MSWGPGNAASCPAWLHVASLVPYQLQPSTGVFRAESCSRNVKFCTAPAEGGGEGPFRCVPTTAGGDLLSEMWDWLPGLHSSSGLGIPGPS